MGMLIDNLAAFTEALGVENAPTVVHLSFVPWPDVETRDEFIRELSGYDPRSMNG